MPDFVFQDGVVIMGVCVFLAAWSYLPVPWGAPWVPTSLATARKMLEMADVKPGEVVVDIGAGDGRIVVVAAREFGATATGVEIDSLRCLLANIAIALPGVRGRAHVHHGNMFSFDASNADVVVVSRAYSGSGGKPLARDGGKCVLDGGAAAIQHTFPPSTSRLRPPISNAPSVSAPGDKPANQGQAAS